MVNEVGIILRNARKEKGLTLKDLESKTGISYSQISKIERGIHQPSKENLMLISNVLNCNIINVLEAAGFLYNKQLDDRYILLRYHILCKNNFTCQLCGASGPSQKVDVYHIIPTDQDGSNNSENLITLCNNCGGARREFIKEHGIEKDYLFKKYNHLNTKNMD